MQITRTMRRAATAVAITGLAIGAPAVSLAASGSSSAAPATFVRCHAGQLTAWIGTPGDGAAGSTYYELELSNTSAQACELYGYPGVSAVRPGGQIGSAAGRDHSHPATVVTLSPGATSHVILEVTDVGNFSPGACRPKQALSLKVYAPGAYSWLQVPFTLQACGKRGPVFLHVSVDIAGTGVPGYSY
jgi:Protein of unknown function (DUF4232)